MILQNQQAHLKSLDDTLKNTTQAGAMQSEKSQ